MPSWLSHAKSLQLSLKKELIYKMSESLLCSLLCASSRQTTLNASICCISCVAQVYAFVPFYTHVRLSANNSRWWMTSCDQIACGSIYKWEELNSRVKETVNDLDAKPSILSRVHLTDVKEQIRTQPDIDVYHHPNTTWAQRWVNGHRENW